MPSGQQAKRGRQKRLFAEAYSIEGPRAGNLKIGPKALKKVPFLLHIKVFPVLNRFLSFLQVVRITTKTVLFARAALNRAVADLLPPMEFTTMHAAPDISARDHSSTNIKFPLACPDYLC